LIEGNTLDENTLDALLNIFKAAVKNVAAGVRNEKLEQSVTMVEKLKNMESTEKQKDQADLDDLDAMLQNF
jgi:hypothetical protein